jgi:hypothetical protein
MPRLPQSPSSSDMKTIMSMSLTDTQVVTARGVWWRHLSAAMANSCVVPRVNDGRGVERLLRPYKIRSCERFY